MIEFFLKKENYKLKKLESFKVGDCFSIYPIGHSDFEIFIIRDSIEDDMISAVSLKTGGSFSFSTDAKGYPLDLKVTYSYQH